MFLSQSYSKLFDKLLIISYKQHNFKSYKKQLPLIGCTSRFYSSNYYNKNCSQVGSLTYISNHQRSFIICSGRFRTVNNLDKNFTLQRRNFSFKESFDSAVVTHSDIFKSISESFVVEKAQHFIIQFHDSTGLPWWLSIILTTCIARFTLTLPLALYQVSNGCSK